MDRQRESISCINCGGIRFKPSHHDTGLCSFCLLSIAADKAAARFTDRLHIDRQLSRFLTPDTRLRIPDIEYQRIIPCHNVIPGRKRERKFSSIGHRRFLRLIAGNIRFCLQITGHIRFKRPFGNDR